MDTPEHSWMTFTHMDGLKSLDTPGSIEHLSHGTSYGFFQTTLMDSSRSLGSPWPMTLTGKDGFWKVVKLTGTLTNAGILSYRTGERCSKNTFVIQYLWVRCLEDPVILDPLCGEDYGTQNYAAGMDRRHRLTHQVTPSITIDNTFGVPMVWCQARWRLQVLRRWLLCKSCILGHFYVSENCGFTVLWFYIYLDSCTSIWKSYILLKCINFHDEYLK